MRKLRLEIEELSVESFEVAKEQERGGTVRGEQESWTCNVNYTCIDVTCAGSNCPTWDYTCEHHDTCRASCGGSCVGDTCDNFTCRWSGCQQTACMSCPE